MCLIHPSYSLDVSAFICGLSSLHGFFLNTTSHSERIQICHLLTVWSVWFNSAVSWVSQLQLEIALLQGELQTEKKQLLRHTQKLQALQQEPRKTEKNRHSSRQKVPFPFFIVLFIFLNSVNCIVVLNQNLVKATVVNGFCEVGCAQYLLRCYQQQHILCYHNGENIELHSCFNMLLELAGVFWRQQLTHTIKDCSIYLLTLVMHTLEMVHTMVNDWTLVCWAWSWSFVYLMISQLVKSSLITEFI